MVKRLQPRPVPLGTARGLFFCRFLLFLTEKGKKYMIALTPTAAAVAIAAAFLVGGLLLLQSKK